MTTAQLIILVLGILILQGGVWFLVLRWVKRKTQALSQQVREQCQAGRTGFIIEPQSALYRGADAVYGNVKGNGVICLTDQALMFEKLTGQKIKISRADIAEATVQNRFRGNLSLLTGGKYLVLRTKDNNRIGFLVKDVGRWVAALRY